MDRKCRAHSRIWIGRLWQFGLLYLWPHLQVVSAFLVVQSAEPARNLIHLGFCTKEISEFLSADLPGGFSLFFLSLWLFVWEPGTSSLCWLSSMAYICLQS